MSKNQNETKKTNVIALTEKLPLNAPAERPAREKKPSGTLLMSALSDRARERGHDETDLARDLQVTYGYTQQLRKGIRAVNTISVDFAEACPLPPGSAPPVLMPAERITPQDIRSADLYEQDVTRAVEFIAEDRMWRPPLTAEPRNCCTDTLFGVVRMYEATTKTTLIPNRVDVSVLAERTSQTTSGSDDGKPD